MLKKKFLFLIVVLMSVCLCWACGGGMNSDAGGYSPKLEMGSVDTNEYLELNETPFINTLETPKVNLSLDSSSGGYSNLRKLINNGYYIHKDAVNIEQMLNYFSYSYKNETDEQLASFLEIADCPWNESSKLLSVAVKAKDYQLDDKKPSNFVFLLDVSGSMYSADRLPLMVQAFNVLIENLGPNDRVSIVTYAGAQQILLDGGFGYEKTKISAIISDLEASGSTAGAAGIKTAYELAAKHFIEGGNNRVFLATDGDFNVGISSITALERLIAEKRETGVYLSLFGFGQGNLQADTMDTLARAGNGNYYYIDSILEAKKVFVSELGGTLQTVAKDAKAQIEFNPNLVSQYRVIGYENKHLTDDEFENSKTDAGEIGAGHTTVCLIEIKLAEASSQAEAEYYAKSTLRYKDVLANETEKEIKSECYHIAEAPSIDMTFQAAVAEFGLILRDSQYKANASIESILAVLDKQEYQEDPFKKELAELVRKYVSNSYNQ